MVTQSRSSPLLTANRVVFTAFLLLFLRDRPHHDAIGTNVNTGPGLRGLCGLSGSPVRGKFSVLSETFNLVGFLFCDLTQPFFADAKARSFLQRPTGLVETLQCAHQRTQLRSADRNATTIDSKQLIHGIHTPRGFGPEVAAMEFDRSAGGQNGNGM